jgi:hypothetical protein
MKNFLYSPKMLYILAGLLVLVFFLPDIIGPIPAIICGGIVIGISLYIYNLWSKQVDKDKTVVVDDASDDDQAD